MQSIEGDLLFLTCDSNYIIIQQCNCLTVTSHGLSQSITDKYPEANIYSLRRRIDNRNIAIPSDRGVPGTYVVTKINKTSTMTVQKNNMYVGALMGQWRPGKIGSRYHNIYPESDPPETSKQREIWFEQSLVDLEKYLKDFGILAVAFPYMIGCGLAGGNWENYKRMIEQFAQRNKDISVHIVKKST